jgi:hypothetical protein
VEHHLERQAIPDVPAFHLLVRPRSSRPDCIWSINPVIVPRGARRAAPVSIAKSVTRAWRTRTRDSWVEIQDRRREDVGHVPAGPESVTGRTGEPITVSAESDDHPGNDPCPDRRDRGDPGGPVPADPLGVSSSTDARRTSGRIDRHVVEPKRSLMVRPVAEACRDAPGGIASSLTNVGPVRTSWSQRPGRSRPGRSGPTVQSDKPRSVGDPAS